MKQKIRIVVDRVNVDRENQVIVLETEVNTLYADALVTISVDLLRGLYASYLGGVHSERADVRVYVDGKLNFMICHRATVRIGEGVLVSCTVMPPADMKPIDLEAFIINKAREVHSERSATLAPLVEVMKSLCDGVDPMPSAFKASNNDDDVN